MNYQKPPPGPEDRCAFPGVSCNECIYESNGDGSACVQRKCDTCAGTGLVLKSDTDSLGLFLGDDLKTIDRMMKARGIRKPSTQAPVQIRERSFLGFNTSVGFKPSNEDDDYWGVDLASEVKARSRGQLIVIDELGHKKVKSLSTNIKRRITLE